MYLIRLSCSLESFPLTFTPGGDLVGFVNAMMVPAGGAGETIEQVIDLHFGSTPADCARGVSTLSEWLELAAAEAAKPAGSLVYLECQVAASDELYRSPVFSGWLELARGGVDQRETGAMGGRLHVMRANWWERSAEVTLIDAAPVGNHRDAGHSNALYTIANVTTDEDLVAQARVTAALDTVVSAPAGLFIGERAGSPGVLDLFYEGQDGAARAGVTGSSVADAASSDGSYYNLAWNGAAETRLWQVDIDAARLAKARGKPFRVVMRLADGIPNLADEKTWARWEIAYVDDGGVERFLYESPGAYLPPACELVLGPALYLPPWAVSGAAPQLRVVLKVSAAGAGAHALKLDFVDFCPLDGWRCYDPALQSYGVSVEDSGQSGMAGAAGGVLTHALEGPGFAIHPRLGHQFQCYFYVKESAAEITASANLSGTLSVFYRPRRRML